MPTLAMAPGRLVAEVAMPVEFDRDDQLKQIEPFSEGSATKVPRPAGDPRQASLIGR